MDAAVDSSTLISLAWSGSLWLIEKSPMSFHIPVPVREEVVAAGVAHGYADAAAIESATKDCPSLDVGTTSGVDAAVLEAGVQIGALLCNDIALGRRASNLGVTWLRTADLVMVSVKARAIDAERGREVLESLRDTGRITDELLQSYLEELT